MHFKDSIHSSLLWQLPLLAGFCIPRTLEAQETSQHNIKVALNQTEASELPEVNNSEVRKFVLNRIIEIQRKQATTEERVEEIKPYFEKLNELVKTAPDITLDELKTIHGLMVSRVGHFILSFLGSNDILNEFYTEEFIDFKLTLIKATENCPVKGEAQIIDRDNLVATVRATLFDGDYSQTTRDGIWQAAIKAQTSLAVKNHEFDNFNSLEKLISINPYCPWMTRRFVYQERQKFNQAAKKLYQDIEKGEITYDSEEAKAYGRVISIIYRSTCPQGHCEDRNDPFFQAARSIMESDILIPAGKHLPLLMSQNINLSDADAVNSQSDYIQEAQLSYDSIEILYNAYKFNPIFRQEYKKHVNEIIAKDELTDKNKALLYRQVSYLADFFESTPWLTGLLTDGLKKEDSAYVVQEGLGSIYTELFARQFPNSVGPQVPFMQKYTMREITADISDVYRFRQQNERLTTEQRLLYAIMQNAVYDYTFDPFYPKRPITLENYESLFTLRKNCILATRSLCNKLLPSYIDDYEDTKHLIPFNGGIVFIEMVPVYIHLCPTPEDIEARRSLVKTLTEKMSGFGGEIFTVPIIADQILTIMKLAELHPVNNHESGESFSAQAEIIRPYFNRVSREPDAPLNFFTAEYQNTRAAMYSEKFHNIPDLSKLHNETIDNKAMENADKMREQLSAEVIYKLLISRECELNNIYTSSDTLHYKNILKFLQQIGITEHEVMLNGKLDSFVQHGKVNTDALKKWHSEF